MILRNMYILKGVSGYECKSDFIAKKVCTFG